MSAGGGGGAVPGITGDGRWRERDSKGDKRVRVSLGEGGSRGRNKCCGVC